MARVQQDSFTPRRETLVKFDNKFDWVPHWQGEASIAVDGLENRILTADRFKGSVAIKSVIKKARKYQIEALDDTEYLSAPLLSPSDILPLDEQILRENTFTLRAIAKHILFKEALAKDKWPDHNPQYLLAEKLNPIEEDLYEMTSLNLKRNWLESYTSANSRQAFWLQALMNAHVNPKVRSALGTEDS